MHHPPWFLFLTAFVTGAVVMALEILGSRLLAPVFGNSLFVWGALIGVILAAMSSGYAFGGWVSDRRPGGQVLAALLLVSGAWTFLIAWIGQAVLFRVAGTIEDPAGVPVWLPLCCSVRQPSGSVVCFRRCYDWLCQIWSILAATRVA